MSEKNKVVKAGIGYTVGNYLLKGLSFFSLPIFTRLLSTADYGVYNTFLAYESIFFVIIGLAIHSSYKNARYKYKKVEEGAKKGQDYYSYVSSTMLLLIVNLALWLIVINVFSPFWKNLLDLNREEQNLLILYSFSTAVITCFNTYVGIEYRYKSFLLVAAINAIGNICLSLVFILTIYNGQRYMGRIMGTTIISVVLSTIIIFLFLKRARPCNEVHFLKWGLHYSLPIVPHGLSQIILSQFDRIMIKRMISDSTAGIYSFAYNIFSIIQVTANSLDSVWSPWFYEKMNAGNKGAIKKYGSLYAIFMLIYSFILMLVSPELIKLMGTNEYRDSMYCVMPLIAGGYFAFLYNLPACIEYYYEKTKFIMIGTMTAALLNIILNYVFIMKYGYIAAAYTTLITYFLYFLFHYFLARKIEGEFIYSNKTILFVSVGIIIANFFSIIFMKMPVVRWGVAIFIGIITIMFEEKKFGIINKKICLVRENKRE